MQFVRLEWFLKTKVILWEKKSIENTAVKYRQHCLNALVNFLYMIAVNRTIFSTLSACRNLIYYTHVITVLHTVMLNKSMIIMSHG